MSINIVFQFQSFTFGDN